MRIGCVMFGFTSVCVQCPAEKTCGDVQILRNRVMVGRSMVFGYDWLRKKGMVGRSIVLTIT